MVTVVIGMDGVIVSSLPLIVVEGFDFVVEDLWLNVADVVFCVFEAALVAVWDAELIVSVDGMTLVPAEMEVTGTEVAVDFSVTVVVVHFVAVETVVVLVAFNDDVEVTVD